jgi:hypothetical protein
VPAPAAGPEAPPACDWVGMVFAHADVASIFASFVVTIEGVAALGGVCRTLRNETRTCLKTNKQIWWKNPRHKWGNVAASQDNLRMMRYARDRGLLDPSWVSSAAATGSMRALQWLHKICKVTLKAEHAASAARNGKLEALKWLVAHGSPNLKNNACVPIEAAASEGEVECLKWLLENMELDCQPLIPAMQGAAKYGHVACMDLLWKAERPRPARVALNVMMCQQAASNGHLGALAWLHEHNAPWRDGAASAAAENGHLDCLKYMIAHGLCTDEESRANALYHAARGCNNGTNLEPGPEPRTRSNADKIACFKYLADEVGAEITDEFVTEFVVRYNCVELVDFCAARGHLPTARDLDHVAQNNWGEMVVCLRRHGVPWQRSTVRRMLKKHAWLALQTALRNGAPVDFGAKYAVAKYNLVEGGKILHEHGHCLGELDGLLLRIAVENDAKEVAEWLLNHDIRYRGRQWRAWEHAAKEQGREHMNETHALVAARQPYFMHQGGQ